MRVAVVGSRKYTDFNGLKNVLNHIRMISCIISGGAKGADALAEKYAEEHNLPCKIFLPKFKTDPKTPYHARWYIARNKEIVDNSDIVIAFWDGKSKGTKNTITYAKKQKKEIKVIKFTP